MKAGTPTGFQDKNGTTIKVGDRIKHADGTINVIDKFGKAQSVFGFKYDLDKVGTLSRGMAPDGTYFARITDWEITDDPAPAEAVIGETVKPGNDGQNMAPADMTDPQAGKAQRPKRKRAKTAEAKAVEDGVTPDEARDLILRKYALEDYSDEDLTDELRGRGYKGEITKTKTIKI